MERMNIVKLYFFIIFFFSLGCIAHQTEMGQRLDPAKLSQIMEGQTTEAEAIALLGSPQHSFTRPDGSKILMYSHHLTQIYGRPGLNDAKGGTSRETLFLGIRDGIVKKKWQSSSNMPMRMTTGQTLSVPDQFK